MFQDARDIDYFPFSSGSTSISFHLPFHSPYHLCLLHLDFWFLIFTSQGYRLANLNLLFHPPSPLPYHPCLRHFGFFESFLLPLDPTLTFPATLPYLPPLLRLTSWLLALICYCFVIPRFFFFFFFFFRYNEDSQERRECI